MGHFAKPLDQIPEVWNHLRRAAGEVHRVDVRACQPGEDPVKSVAVDDFFPLRTCVYMAVNTGEIAAFADVDLSISPRTAGQHPSSSLLHTTNRELAKRRSRRDARATSAKPIPAPLSSKQFARPWNDHKTVA